MKQTIEIEVPEGKQAIWKDDKIVFEDIKPKLPKTWEEFCKTYKSTYVLPSKYATEQHLALMQLHQLRDCYRQGWKPNYAENSKKWSITKFKNKLYAISTCHYSSFLSFQTEEIAEQFLTNFRELIEQAGDLI